MTDTFGIASITYEINVDLPPNAPEIDWTSTRDPGLLIKTVRPVTATLEGDGAVDRTLILRWDGGHEVRLALPGDVALTDLRSGQFTYYSVFRTFDIPEFYADLVRAMVAAVGGER